MLSLIRFRVEVRPASHLFSVVVLKGGSVSAHGITLSGFERSASPPLHEIALVPTLASEVSSSIQSRFVPRRLSSNRLS